MIEQEAIILQCIEECNELAQTLSKALRFGFFEMYLGKDNFSHVQHEYNDLIASLQLLDKSLDSNQSIMSIYPHMIENKKKNIEFFLKKSRSLGTVK